MTTDLATQAAERAEKTLRTTTESDRARRHANDVLALVAALKEARAEIADLAPREADLWDENTGLKAALQTAEAERDNWKREAEARRERKVLCEDLASKLRAAETREKTLLALVVEAYDEWGDEGHPSNAWRKKAETLGACAALSGTGTGSDQEQMPEEDGRLSIRDVLDEIDDALEKKWKDRLDLAQESDDDGSHVGLARHHRAISEGIAQAQEVVRDVIASLRESAGTGQ